MQYSGYQIPPDRVCQHSRIYSNVAPIPYITWATQPCAKRAGGICPSSGRVLYTRSVGAIRILAPRPTWLAVTGPKIWENFFSKEKVNLQSQCYWFAIHKFMAYMTRTRNFFWTISEPAIRSSDIGLLFVIPCLPWQLRNSDIGLPFIHSWQNHFQD